MSPRNFAWNSLPAVGSAGGILVGVDEDIYDVISWKNREFSMACQLRYKPKDVVFNVIFVYASPYEDGKESFISELHTIFLETTGPIQIGGDFNLVRYQTDKSNGNVDQKWCDKFNAWVEIWNLLEIRLSHRRYTWANYQ